jgi:hypothetical protein
MSAPEAPFDKNLRFPYTYIVGLQKIDGFQAAFLGA